MEQQVNWFENTTYSNNRSIKICWHNNQYGKKIHVIANDQK